ncbi:hypothetical protein [Actinomadura terrae]|uniref:hypothetical protein n=1 Tax=Actinomadura terrae TaxID=604353 RepID=UPI001FA6BB69|nr:hypothetical protein [Actinomadura terrae]
MDRSWVAAHHNGKALLHRVDAPEGLTKTDSRVLDEWLCQQETPAFAGASI